ncbi:hypothetical protein CesoFtcFv8_007224 [Champsocephalus esox]|uniref:Uncharacterized protein n=1 Tax=Champsocephalus esox TaxID=159716 RepID=A0AAN8H4N2_9TELE|nr:hypothetical protein CesoFtcFv8_007224 [Champsocephalus esox]
MVSGGPSGGLSKGERGRLVDTAVSLLSLSPGDPHTSWRWGTADDGASPDLQTTALEPGEEPHTEKSTDILDILANKS